MNVGFTNSPLSPNLFSLGSLDFTINSILESENPKASLEDYLEQSMFQETAFLDLLISLDENERKHEVLETLIVHPLFPKVFMLCLKTRFFFACSLIHSIKEFTDFSLFVQEIASFELLFRKECFSIGFQQLLTIEKSQRDGVKKTFFSLFTRNHLTCFFKDLGKSLPSYLLQEALCLVDDETAFLFGILERGESSVDNLIGIYKEELSEDKMEVLVKTLQQKDVLKPFLSESHRLSRGSLGSLFLSLGGDRKPLVRALSFFPKRLADLAAVLAERDSGVSETVFLIGEIIDPLDSPTCEALVHYSYRINSIALPYFPFWLASEKTLRVSVEEKLFDAALFGHREITYEVLALFHRNEFKETAKLLLVGKWMSIQLEKEGPFEAVTFDQLMKQIEPILQDQESVRELIPMYRTALEGIRPYFFSLAMLFRDYQSLLLALIPYLSEEQQAGCFFAMGRQVIRVSTISLFKEWEPYSLKQMLQIFCPRQRELFKTALFKYLQQEKERKDIALLDTISLVVGSSTNSVDAILAKIFQFKGILSHFSSPFYSILERELPEVLNCPEYATVKEDYEVDRQKYFQEQHPINSFLNRHCNDAESELSEFILYRLNGEVIRHLDLGSAEEIALYGLKTDRDFAFLGITMESMRAIETLRGAIYALCPQQQRAVKELLDAYLNPQCVEFTDRHRELLSNLRASILEGGIDEERALHLLSLIPKTEHLEGDTLYEVLSQYKEKKEGALDVENALKMCLIFLKRESFFGILSTYFRQEGLRDCFLRLRERSIFSISQLFDEEIIEGRDALFSLNDCI